MTERNLPRQLSIMIQRGLEYITTNPFMVTMSLGNTAKSQDDATKAPSYIIVNEASHHLVIKVPTSTIMNEAASYPQ